jgi:hypothetical protein
MMSERLHLFGIRHHGPGSAHSLRRALDRLDPAVVLIEGPPEADGVAAFANSPHMEPPVALLIHAKDKPRNASFFPLAEYSPEWIAMRWALSRARPMRFIDLPASVRLAKQEEDAAKAEQREQDAQAQQNEPTDAHREGDDDKDDESDGENIAADPLSYLASLAGYEDGETWWNNLVEQGTHAEDLFGAVERAMTALREKAPFPPKHRPQEAHREAHMRLAIRETLNAQPGDVAVVTGAWHVPALRSAVPVKDDRALLKGLPKTDTVATWVPWTDTRLAFRSGYGAGVVSPGWYRHLWAALGEHAALDARTLGVGWAARVATLLRGEGLPASTALVIDAVRLAEALASLRGLATPGLSEFQSACLATLCGGNTAPLQLIHDRLVIGTRVGAIDEAVPLMPLLADLARAQKRLRMPPEATQSELSVDLRSEAGLAKSTLLHRLALIDVPWGKLTDAGGSRGSFRERWILAWEPELGVALVEALRWGTTIADAAAGAATERAAEMTDAGALATLIRGALLADLPAAAEHCIDRLQEVAARSGEVGQLMDAAPPLVDVLRYGTARPIPEQPLRRLVSGMVSEICIGLPVAVRQLDADAASAMLRRASGLDRSLPLLEDPALTEAWRGTLGRIAADGGAVPLLRGFAQRKLYDARIHDEPATAAALSRALSPSVAPAEAAGWLLDDAGRLLLHDGLLRGLLDEWVCTLPVEELETLLPQLRRAFGGLDAMERRRLLAAMRETAPAGSSTAEMADEASAFAAALPLLKTILGLAQ